MILNLVDTKARFYETSFSASCGGETVRVRAWPGFDGILKMGQAPSLRDIFFASCEVALLQNGFKLNGLELNYGLAVR